MDKKETTNRQWGLQELQQVTLLKMVSRGERIQLVHVSPKVWHYSRCSYWLYAWNSAWCYQNAIDIVASEEHQQRALVSEWQADWNWLTVYENQATQLHHSSAEKSHCKLWASKGLRITDILVVLLSAMSAWNSTWKVFSTFHSFGWGDISCWSEQGSCFAETFLHHDQGTVWFSLWDI